MLLFEAIPAWGVPEIAHLTVLNMLHKPKCNKINSQRYDAERECRFVAVLNKRLFIYRGSELDIKNLAKFMIHPMTPLSSPNYIEELYYYSTEHEPDCDSSIEAACHVAGIAVRRQNLVVV